MSDKNQPRNGSGSGQKSGAKNSRPRNNGKRSKRKVALRGSRLPEPAFLEFGLEALPRR